MSVPSRNDHKAEGSGPLFCEGSGAYCGLLAGHRVDCPDCGRRAKVARQGYVANHYPPRNPRTAGDDSGRPTQAEVDAISGSVYTHKPTDTGSSDGERG